MTFILNSNMSTVTQTISAQNTTQAILYLINHIYGPHGRPQKKMQGGKNILEMAILVKAMVR